ncbi:MAG: hypothetical protein A3J65_04660 [Candidatus Buchananbacteria bacterium RIFCSPHIGHO2_02_FULL_45_11b]|uniref:Glycosyl transferase family 1 n=1 Tax=Candidatus Buchananbacteria bacterium RIFCSPHIGHO2_02_FULL_45_11b TaxID=1797541 RepID=A0A1G1YD72_9BACT|nr:MAG: hypothetical protein A3J65_04660 [Candidatus Buchananbacteria bacterium RIFCSPHIGHO2_02_FULL_45_11b]
MAKISKILYIITQSEWGGAQRYVFDLATNLPKNEFEVIVAAGGDQELFPKLASRGVKTAKIKHLTREISPVSDLLATIEICRLIKAIRPDIVHLNSSKASIVGSLASFLARHSLNSQKHRLIYTVHGFVFNEPMSRAKKIFYIWLEKMTAMFKDKLICVSEFDRQQGLIHKICRPNKLITINNGIPPLIFLEPAAGKIELGLPQDKIIIGAIANFYETKGLSFLIKAAAEIISAHPEVFFVLIGEGELRPKLEKEIENLGLKNNFLLSGAKPEAYKYLSAFDLFVLPSIKEGFSYTILEAMQAAKPIIATEVGGNPEMIIDGENGLLVKPAGPEELAGAINKILSDKNLAPRLGRQAKIDVSQKFRLEKMLGETEKIYLN